MTDARELKYGAAWTAFGDRLGWSLYGWSSDASATFVMPSGATVQVYAELRDMFQAALDAAYEDGRRSALPAITAARLDRAIDAAGPALAAATEIAEKMAACRERERLVQVGALADDGVAVQRVDGE